MATIRDVAKKANVSITTVSRILNGDPTLKVSTDTRAIVKKSAEELNYVVLKKKKSRHSFTIGILQWFSIDEEINDPFYLYIRQGVEDFCNKNDIKVIRTFKNDINYIDSLKDVDGLICIGKFSIDEVKNLNKKYKRIIFIDLCLEKIIVNTVTLDFKNAIYDSLDLLQSLNHKKIGYLGGLEYLDGNILYDDPRKKYFIKYCKKNKIDYEKYILEESFNIESGYNMMIKMIKEDNLPTAFIAASDSIGIGALNALHENNIKIPEEIAIIGFNNIRSSEFTNPPLTTVNAPAFEMGQYAANFILDFKDIGVPVNTMFPCKIIKRKTT